MSEICNDCGNSVSWGSGRFVNRIPDCDDTEIRKKRGCKFPEGEWVCAECEDKYYEERDKDERKQTLLDAIDKLDLEELLTWLYTINNEVYSKLAELPSWGKDCNCDSPERVEVIGDNNECENFCAVCGGGMSKW